MKPARRAAATSAPMPTDLIRYDLLAQDALRGVVRRVLVDAAREAMHFPVALMERVRAATPGIVALLEQLAPLQPQEA